MIDLEKMSTLWIKGHSMAQIGNEMGLTKGQVSGRVSRNRTMFPPRIDPIKRLEADIAGVLIESIAEDKKAKARTSNELRKLFSDATKPAQAIPSKAENKAYDESRIPYALKLVDLGKHQCRWPVTENPKGVQNLFCAEMKSSKNYCKDHSDRAWRAV